MTDRRTTLDRAYSEPSAMRERDARVRAAEQQREEANRRGLVELLGMEYRGHPSVSELNALVLERLHQMRMNYFALNDGPSSNVVAKAIRLTFYTLLHRNKPLPPGRFEPSRPAPLK